MPVYDHAIILRLHPWSNNLISQSSLIEKFLSSSYNSTEVSIETAGWSTCFVYLEVEKFWRKWPKATRFVVEMTWFDGGKGSGVVRKFQPRTREDAFRDKLLDCPIRLALRDGSFSGTVKIVLQPQIEGRQSVRNLEAYTAIFHYVPSPVAYSSPLERDRQLFIKGGWIPFFRRLPWLSHQTMNAKPRSAVSQPVVQTASVSTASEVLTSASSSSVHAVQLAQSIEAMRNEIEELKRQQLEEELEELDAELKTLRELKRTKSSTDRDATLRSVSSISAPSDQGYGRASLEQQVEPIPSSSSVIASPRLAAASSVQDHPEQRLEDNSSLFKSLSSPIRAGSSSTAQTDSSLLPSSPRRKPKLSQRFLDRVRNHCMEDRELKTNQRRSATAQTQKSETSWLPPSDEFEQRHPPGSEHPSCREQPPSEANQQDEKEKAPAVEPSPEKARDKDVASQDTSHELSSAAEGQTTPVAPSRPSIAIRTAVKRTAMDPFVGSEERDKTPEAIKRYRIDNGPSIRPKTMTPPEGDAASPTLAFPQSARASEQCYWLIDDDDDDDGYGPSTPV